MSQAIDPQPKDDLIDYAQYLLSTRQIKDCYNLRLEKTTTTLDIVPRCKEGRAVCVPAHNGAQKLSSSRVSWEGFSCPEHCSIYHRNPHFLKTLAASAQIEPHCAKEVKSLFISHIKEEKALALALEEWIESTFADQCTVFVSSNPEDLPPGQEWEDKVHEALREAQLLLVVCSHVSINRPWINYEIGFACNRNIPIIPVCHSDLSPEDLPLPLSKFNALSLEQDDCCRVLIGSIASTFGMPACQTVNFAAFGRDLRTAVSRCSKG